MVVLTPATLARMEALFAPQEREAARKLLEEECADNLPFCAQSSSQELERLRFAVLKLSAGNLPRLRQEIDQAKRDWRDTLMAAGYGEDVNAHRHWWPGGGG